MSKINNKVLLVVLLVLAGAYFGNKYLGDSRERNFREVLVDLDTSLVDKIVVAKPTTSGEEIIITKTGVAKWDVSTGNLKDEGDIGMIRSMLSAHKEMKPERLVSNNRESWAQYEVSDSLGVNVKMFSKEKLLSEIMVGKFDFQQATRSMATMVRLVGEDQIFAVDGMLSSTFNLEFDALRNKTFLKAETNTIQSVTLDYPADSSFRLAQVEGGQWQINGQPADSTASIKYVNGLLFLNLREFVNDFNPEEQEPLYKLTIEGDSIATIVVYCWKPEDKDYVLHSTLNPGAYFHKGVNNIFEKLFPAPSRFYPKPE